MIWRPWVVTALLITAVLFNALLLYQERIPSRVAETEVVTTDERLKNLQYNAGTRRDNFKLMGMGFDLAESTANQFSRFEKQKGKLERLLDEQASELIGVLCPGELPQPYSALSILVVDENGTRNVVDAVTLVRFEPQPWYAASNVDGLYDRFERTKDRRADATLMAVSAVLLNQESAALDGESPWSTGVVGTWGFGRLQKRSPKVTQLAIEYFALMHFLTELANTKKGICS